MYVYPWSPWVVGTSACRAPVGRSSGRSEQPTHRQAERRGGGGRSSYEEPRAGQMAVREQLGGLTGRAGRFHRGVGR